jgi:hypothetical protein
MGIGLKRQFVGASFVHDKGNIRVQTFQISYQVHHFYPYLFAVINEHAVVWLLKFWTDKFKFLLIFGSEVYFRSDRCWWRAAGMKEGYGDDRRPVLCLSR